MYLSLHCHHQNDSCIKMGSDESHFNVSLTVRDKITRQNVHRPQLLKRKESRSGFRPLRYEPNALPRTSSLELGSIVTFSDPRSQSASAVIKGPPRGLITATIVYRHCSRQPPVIASLHSTVTFTL